jgi:urate oxidase
VTASISGDSWGKSGVRLVRMSHDSDTAGTYEARDLTVDTSLTGDTEDVYVHGDNAKILSTDAQKNAVYAFAGDTPFVSIEAFAWRLARHFVDTQEPVTSATVHISEEPWERIVVDGVPSAHAFRGGAGWTRTAQADADAEGVRIRAGVRGLRLFKATGSEFTGFPRDPYTTGTGASDRALVTELSAEWLYAPHLSAGYEGWDDDHRLTHRLLAETFASVYSKSIQYSMSAMAEAVLDSIAGIESIRLVFPNIHHNPADLSIFGRANDRSVLIPAERPHSMIEATFTR